MINQRVYVVIHGFKSHLPHQKQEDPQHIVVADFSLFSNTLPIQWRQNILTKTKEYFAFRKVIFAKNAN